MKKIDLTQTVSIVANIGVVVGIGLLAYELNQNRQMTAAQTRHEMAQGIMGWLSNLATDGELVEIILKVESGAPTSPAEEFRYFAFRNMQVRYWEDVHYQYRSGLFDDDEFTATRETWIGVLSEPRVRRFWAEYKHTYSPEFAAEIDEILRELTVNE